MSRRMSFGDPAIALFESKLVLEINMGSALSMADPDVISKSTLDEICQLTSGRWYAEPVFYRKVYDGFHTSIHKDGTITNHPMLVDQHMILPAVFEDVSDALMVRLSLTQDVTPVSSSSF